MLGNNLYLENETNKSMMLNTKCFNVSKFWVPYQSFSWIVETLKGFHLTHTVRWTAETPRKWSTNSDKFAAARAEHKGVWEGEKFTLDDHFFSRMIFNHRNYCYLVGFKHGVNFADKKRSVAFEYFSVTVDACPCAVTAKSFESFQNGFHDGYNLK
jgi:hypothetical protein